MNAIYISSKCLYVLIQLQQYRRVKAGLNVSSVGIRVYQHLPQTVIVILLSVSTILILQVSIFDVDFVEP